MMKISNALVLLPLLPLFYYLLYHYLFSTENKKNAPQPILILILFIFLFVYIFLYYKNSEESLNQFSMSNASSIISGGSLGSLISNFD